MVAFSLSPSFPGSLFFPSKGQTLGTRLLMAIDGNPIKSLESHYTIIQFLMKGFKPPLHAETFT